MPVMKKELDVEHEDGTNNLKLCDSEEVAGIELDENMQEIDHLLAEEHEPMLVAVDDSNLELENDFDSDSLSDHFGDAFFSSKSENQIIDIYKKEETYEFEKHADAKKSNLLKTKHIKTTENSKSNLQTDANSKAYKYNADFNSKCGVQNQNACLNSIPVLHNMAVMFSPIIESTKNEIKENKVKATRHKAKELNTCRENIECNICGTTFTHINSLKQHLMKHSGEKPFKCEFCEKCFARKTILTIHRRLHTGDRPYRCDECIRTFVTKEALNRHKEREHDEDVEASFIKNKVNFICSICHKARCSKYSLAAHMRTHHLEKERLVEPKPKTSCRNYRSRIDRPQKIVLTTDADGKQLATVKYCKICQQGFASKWELIAHEESHEATQIFECDVCQRAFEKKYQLLYHLQTHEDMESLIKKYVYSTKDRKNSRTEMQTQLGFNASKDEQPLVQCCTEEMQSVKIRRSKRGKANQSTSSLDVNEDKLEYIYKDIDRKNIGLTFKHSKRKKRIRKQTNLEEVIPVLISSLKSNTFLGDANKSRSPRDNSIQDNCIQNKLLCQLCKQAFSNFALLKVHMFKHSGDRPFQCDHCGKSFGCKNVLNIHLRFHTERKSFKCPLCKSTCVSKDALVCHITEMHKQQITTYESELSCGMSNAIQDHAVEKQNKSVYTEKVNKIIMYRCNLCGKKFSLVDEYTDHLDVHLESNSIFKCEICDIKFEKKFNLLYHMQKHEIEKELCNK